VLTAAVEGIGGDDATPRPNTRNPPARAATKWRGKDGLIEFNFAIGPLAGRFTNGMVQWMIDEHVDVGRLAEWDFSTLHLDLASGAVTEAEIDAARDLVGRFLASKTRMEVTEAAVARKLLPVGIFDVSDIGRSRHFRERGLWLTLGEGARAVTMPGPFAHIDVPAFEHRRPAPLIGEHTEEVAAEWLRGPSARRPAEVRDVLHQPPFEGLKVVDLSWALAGPLIGRALADFGATVVRVESSTRMDLLRLLPPFPRGVPDPEGSGTYETTNAGKMGLCLDLSTEEGRQVLRDLVAWADVLIESFSPGTLERWGLGPAELKELNRRLIVLRTTLCGQDGPWSSLAGFGDLGSALAGFQHLVGWPDRDPIGPLGPYTDYVGPRFALAALLAALDWRADHGPSCVIDLSQVEAGIWFLAPEMAEWFATGAIAQRAGNQDRAYSPHGVYRCAPNGGRDEAWVAIVVRDDHEWTALAVEMGRGDLAGEPRFATVTGRREVAPEIDEIVTAWTSSLEAGEAERRLQAVGVPAHRVASSADFCRDAQIAHRGHLVHLPHPKFGQVVVEGPRYRLSETPGKVRRHAPRFHEDTDRVLREVLGYSDDRVATLRELGVLQ
jgi:crotonobetainyl-CoA:carnitine CoA-transferase CaiB-like acyl-CoA transferase